MIELEKKVPGKYNGETLDFIPLMTLVGVNHRQPILHMSKIMFHCYSIDESINLLAISSQSQGNPLPPPAHHARYRE